MGIWLLLLLTALTGGFLYLMWTIAQYLRVATQERRLTIEELEEVRELDAYEHPRSQRQ